MEVYTSEFYDIDVEIIYVFFVTIYGSKYSIISSRRKIRGDSESGYKVYVMEDFRVNNR